MKDINKIIEKLRKEFIKTQCEEMEGDEDRYAVYENDGELVADWWIGKIDTLLETQALAVEGMKHPNLSEMETGSEFMTPRMYRALAHNQALQQAADYLRAQKIN